MYKTLKFEVNNGIATVMMNRPERMNAINWDVFDELAAVGAEIKADKQIRVVVLHGAGGNFCAGLDTSIFTDDKIGFGLIPRTFNDMTNVYQEAAWVWHDVPVPVIAAVDGACLGGGLQIASGADMRYVHPKAKMSILEIKWGLVPDMGGTLLWSRYVKQDLLRELSYTGEMFSGEQAKDYGFATRLSDDPLALAMATAEKIANYSPHAIRANKRLIRHQDTCTEREGLMAESVEQDVLLGSSNQMESIRANMEKRKPVFKDPE